MLLKCLVANLLLTLLPLKFISSFISIMVVFQMVSTISGPIPPHPYYDNQVSDSRASSAGRTRPEGQNYAQKGQSGSIATLLIDGLSIAPQPVRQYRSE